AGDYLFAWIFKNVTARYPAPIPHILSATLAAICDGEVLQLRAMRRLELGFDGYVEIVRKKTATLFAASAECGAIVGGGESGTPATHALRDFGMEYGIAFQMMDDLLDMTSDEASLGKPVGNDLHERKMTLPLIAALAAGDSSFRSRVETFFAAQPEDAEERRAIAGLIGEIGALGGFERTEQAIREYAGRAKRALAGLPPAPAAAELASLADRLAGAKP
ncbi:MAG: polyprenyl synthetase family protein, partial [Candidatus Eremiobacteraeota bacterium]|nr:polyprenyl synthetase family protein [Candidatus Eremiobacteraeota bacterium]